MSGFSTARQKMVDGQVRASDVTDSRILDAMLEVPREAGWLVDNVRDVGSPGWIRTSDHSINSRMLYR